MPTRSEGDKPKRVSALQRAIDAAIGEERKVGREDDPAREAYPYLWEWLTITTDPQGKYLIQPGAVSIRLEPEGVNVSVTIRDIKYSCTVQCMHLEEAFRALESALASDNPPVRTWGKDEPHLRKRRKKD